MQLDQSDHINHSTGHPLAGRKACMQFNASHHPQAKQPDGCPLYSLPALSTRIEVGTGQV